jgi:hypothetical protein
MQEDFYRNPTVFFAFTYQSTSISFIRLNTCYKLYILFNSTTALLKATWTPNSYQLKAGQTDDLKILFTRQSGDFIT